MENDVFDAVVASLSAHLGAPTPHESGTGSRFKSARKGKATVYHSRVASGNRAEIAFEVESMASRLGISQGEFRELVARLQTATARPVDLNAQFMWPRVGLSSSDHAHEVARAIQVWGFEAP